MRRGLRERRRGALELDPGKPVQADHLDQRPNLRLGVAKQDRPPVRAQPPSQHRQVEHQRGIGEGQVGEVDDHVGLGAQRSRQGAPAATLGAAILVSRTAQDRRLVVEVDDCGNLAKRMVPGKDFANF